MNVINLATKRAQTQKYKGITLDQAHEVFRLFCYQLLAAPTVADKIKVDYKIVVGVLDGKIWPQAYQQWIYLSDDKIANDIRARNAKNESKSAS